jgi:SOS-response transcriptional repressor LexA
MKAKVLADKFWGNEGYGTILMRFYQEEDRVLLKQININYKSIEVMDYQVEIKGVLVGIWRSYTEN